MHKTLDTRFPFRGLHGCPSHCHLRLYVAATGERQAPVALVTQCWDSPGTSVTNWAERLAFEVWTTLLADRSHPPEELVWIENYQPAPPEPAASFPIFKNEFDRVTFTPVRGRAGRLVGLTAPYWQEVSRQEVERLIGQQAEAVAAPSLFLNTV